jgi:hypothetical protein
MAEKERPDLMAEAMEAYGIKPEHVFHQRWSADRKYVVIVTKGGKKVTYTAGDQVRKLSDVELSGAPRSAT